MFPCGCNTSAEPVEVLEKIWIACFIAGEISDF